MEEKSPGFNPLQNNDGQGKQFEPLREKNLNKLIKTKKQYENH